MIRLLLISAGTVSLALGIIGIFLPVLPTTPFVLLSAGLFLRSSPALYNKVVSGRITSRYMTRETGRRAGISALVIMWSMILLTVFYAANNAWLKILLIAVGLTGTAFKLRYFFGIKDKQITNNN
ncbi:MAG: YbaN family protein [Bacteroidales bacterium]|nr:YbaN family protein [Bacteroidales bacterium]